MPIYFVHGFRWGRETVPTGVNTYSVIHNLDGVSTNYIQNEWSRTALLEALGKTHGEIMERLQDSKGDCVIQFIEQYDPEDVSGSLPCQPYCYVADRVVTIAASTSAGLNMLGMRTADAVPHVQSSDKSSSSAKAQLLARQTSLSINVEDVIADGPAVSQQTWEALADLRDALAGGEKIGWWVVFNGDPDREWDSPSSSNSWDENDGGSDYSDEDREEGAKTPTQTNPLSEHSLLNQPLPTILPLSMRDSASKNGGQAQVTQSRDNLPRDNAPSPRLPPPPEKLPELQRPASSKQTSERPTTSERPKTSSGRSFTFSLRRKASAGNLPKPSNDEVPDVPQLKDVKQKQGMRSKFFGRK